MCQQGFSQDGETASPNIFERHKNNPVDEFPCIQWFFGIGNNSKDDHFLMIGFKNSQVKENLQILFEYVIQSRVNTEKLSRDVYRLPFGSVPSIGDELER